MIIIIRTTSSLQMKKWRYWDQSKSCECHPAVVFYPICWVLSTGDHGSVMFHQLVVLSPGTQPQHEPTGCHRQPQQHQQRHSHQQNHSDGLFHWKQSQHTETSLYQTSWKKQCCIATFDVLLKYSTGKFVKMLLCSASYYAILYSSLKMNSDISGDLITYKSLH